jgi:hypothetical protein
MIRFLGVVVLIISTVTGVSARQPTIEINQPIPKEFFGLHIQQIAKPPSWNPNAAKTPWPSVKFGSWRLWDAYVAWPSLEPVRGEWDFEILDKYVALAERAGIDLVLPLGLSPTWASARPQEPSNYRPGNAAEPRDMKDWRTYVRTVAVRYKGRIKNYELWNEVNLPGFYSGSKEKLVELAREAYPILKEVDPNIIFVSPSVTGGNRDWLDEYLAKGGASYLDVVGDHFYIPTHSPEAMLRLIKQTQAVMQKHGLGDKPLWNTETGWRIENKQRKKSRLGLIEQKWKNLNDDHAAAYVARSLILSWAMGVSRFYWYAWDNVHMGLIELDTHKLKPAGVAYDKMARLLTGGRLKQCSQNSGVWTCFLIQADGKRTQIVWAEDDVAQDWRIPADWQIDNIEGLHGNALKVSGNSVRIGAAPIFLSIK